MNLFEGKSQVVLRPKTTQEVSQVRTEPELHKPPLCPVAWKASTACCVESS